MTKQETIDSIDIRGLRKTHLNQLRNYILHCGDEGGYYGNKEQFEKRHEELEEWIDSVCDLVNSHGVVITKKQR